MSRGTEFDAHSQPSTAPLHTRAPEIPPPGHVDFTHDSPETPVLPDSTDIVATAPTDDAPSPTEDVPESIIVTGIDGGAPTQDAEITATTTQAGTDDDGPPTASSITQSTTTTIMATSKKPDIATGTFPIGFLPPYNDPSQKTLDHLQDLWDKINNTAKSVWRYAETKPGQSIKNGTKLRILGVGDCITVGIGQNADGDGYRPKLRENLSKNEVVFAGTEKGGKMKDGYFAAWSGGTIDYISRNVEKSLKQRPNIIMLAAGTNDMSDNNTTSTEGHGPEKAVERLGDLADKMIKTCPDATILVSMIIDGCDSVAGQKDRTREFRKLIPGMVWERRKRGHRVAAVGFGSFDTSLLEDLVRPTDKGYDVMGDWWYSFITQIPGDWIEDLIGPDPYREEYS